MKRGFTLIELLMVIALIAIVSTLAVTKVGGVREQSARRVSLANQKAVERAIESYLSFGHRGINRLDSLLDDEVGGGSGEGLFDISGAFARAPTGAGFYRGPDTLVGLEAAQVSEKDAGLTPYLLNTVLTPYALNADEVRALANWGYTYVLRHTTKAGAGQNPRAQYVKGDDGAYLPAEDAIGLDPNRSSCIPRAVTNGMVVAALSPFSSAGREIYRDCGIELLETEQDDAAYRTAATVDELRAKGGALLAFGLGDEASVVGSPDAGLDAAPVATYPNPKFYSRYILLFRVDTSTRAGEVTFAGVLDPCGNSLRQATQAMKKL
jgi:prepilin-type N-terminal cleavage/methylation domain-containing protein